MRRRQWLCWPNVYKPGPTIGRQLKRPTPDALRVKHLLNAANAAETSSPRASNYRESKRGNEYGPNRGTRGFERHSRHWYERTIPRGGEPRDVLGQPAPRT